MWWWTIIAIGRVQWWAIVAVGWWLCWALVTIGRQWCWALSVIGMGGGVGCSLLLVGGGAGPWCHCCGGWCWALIAVGAVHGWCVVMVTLSSHLGVIVSSCGVILPSLWHGHHLLWLWLWSVVIVVGCLLSSSHIDDVAPVSWSGRGLWGRAVGAYLGLDTARHHQTSVDVPCCHCCLPLTCWLLMWHFCIVRMVYWYVQVVVSGWR